MSGTTEAFARVKFDALLRVLDHEALERAQRQRGDEPDAAAKGNVR